MVAAIQHIHVCIDTPADAITAVIPPTYHAAVLERIRRMRIKLGVEGFGRFTPVYVQGPLEEPQDIGPRSYFMYSQDMQVIGVTSRLELKGFEAIITCVGLHD